MPNIGFDVASHLHMQVLALNMSSEEENFVERVVEGLKVKKEECAGSFAGYSRRDGDMQVQVLSVRVLGSERGRLSMLDVKGEKEEGKLMWMWAVTGAAGTRVGVWEESFEQAVVDGERVVGKGFEILVKGMHG